MPENHTQLYQDPNLSRELAAEIKSVCGDTPIRIMEVCGTHTMAVFRHGIRSLLPIGLSLLSGPGCPVCVTSQKEIDAIIRISSIPDVILATFGDLIRVPGSEASLAENKANGADIRIVYSCMDALTIASENPDKTIVFAGVGFETTTPGTAATIMTAKRRNIQNFCIVSAHKTVPQALNSLMEIDTLNIDGFLLPGHVSVITGEAPFRAFVSVHDKPCVITGFEPVDILSGILALTRQIKSGDSHLENAYKRAVAKEGNPQARSLVSTVFRESDAEWRGIGTIPGSGLEFKDEFQDFDALRRFDIRMPESTPPTGCACGEILTGLKNPPDCKLYRKKCTPLSPIGPCMVSTEGTCAAYYRYHT